MTTDEALQSNASSTPATVVPPVELYSGDRMSREEFHRAYKQTPEDSRAELIGGTVYVSSPWKRSHGKPHLHFSGVLAAYESRTQGMECSDNTTVLLVEFGDPKPVKALPGLWINGPALLSQDYARLMGTLEKGLATPEHAAFVQQLAACKAGISK